MEITNTYHLKSVWNGKIFNWQKLRGRTKSEPYHHKSIFRKNWLERKVNIAVLLKEEVELCGGQRKIEWKSWESLYKKNEFEVPEEEKR